MGPGIRRDLNRRVWALARSQHGVVSRARLLALGLSADAIRHRLATGRLHRLWPGVYAVGRPEVTREGLWMAAALACGPQAALAFESAAVLWGIGAQRRPEIELVAPGGVVRCHRGISAHRRTALGENEITRRKGIPVTTPTATLVDLAGCWPPGWVEEAVNRADTLDLVDPETLRTALGDMPYRRGARALRRLLDVRTFRHTDSELERRFLRLVSRAGLPRPLTGRRVNGFKVDFFWPDLDLVVETDGLRYHRTATQQAGDRRRDQAHTAAGTTSLRFTHAQVTFERPHVEAVLRAAAARCRRADSESLREGS